jgi:hypothetical protein
MDSPVAERPMTPSLSHRLKHDKSILALVVSKKLIFAGTEDGEILVCTYLLILGASGLTCVGLLSRHVQTCSCC